MSRRDPVENIDLMEEYAHRAINMCAGLDQEQVADDPTLSLAVPKALELLAEAARRLPEDVRLANPQIPWPNIIGLRNVSVHAYERLEWNVLWKVITEQLPILLDQLRAMRQSIGK